jgi:tRNA(Arg) A34 adenosine deaminase TadA
VNGIVFGCSDRTHRRTRLGRSDTCLRANKVGPVKVAGALAAYGVQSCGIDTGSGRVVVRRLSDGKVLRRDTATSLALGPEPYSSVGSIVVKADGSVAWIGSASSIVVHLKHAEVHKLEKAGDTVLESGAAIKPGSLRLHRSRLTWTDGSHTRSATLR